MKCCICGDEIQPKGPKGTWTSGNNAMPVKKGRCCDNCDERIVIPERIRRRKEEQKNGTVHNNS